MDWAKATARWDENHLSLGILCNLYCRFYGNSSVLAMELSLFCTDPLVSSCIFTIGRLHYWGAVWLLSGLLFQKQLSRAWISNHIPGNTLGCHYLSMSLIIASGTQFLSPSCQSIGLSGFVPSQWETALLCNDVSHWLGANLNGVNALTV